MTTKELIQAEIDNLSEEELEELYRFVKEFVQSKPQMRESSLMARLRAIRIDAPEDFAANFDLYASGEKRVE
jgi:hypothetical protein